MSGVDAGAVGRARRRSRATRTASRAASRAATEAAFRAACRLAPKATIAVAFLIATAFGASPGVADEGDGWYEIERPEPGARERDATADAAPSAAAVGRGGDRLWMARGGDSFASISVETTGSARHADEIARYNGAAPGSTPSSDTLLFVPAALLTPSRSTAREANWEIREFGAEGSAARPSAGTATPDGAVDAGEDTPADGASVDLESAVRAEAAVTRAARPEVQRRDVDLFAGEVEVLGEYDVTRVAIGNGAIVRAEVLATGELLVIAQSPGSTSIRLWHKGGGQSDFNVRVSERDPETRVRMERMVRLRVRMVEFRKSALGRLGVDWSDGTAGPTFASVGDAVGSDLFRPASEGFGPLPNVVQPFSTYFGIAANVTSRINFLASNGDAVTLAEPVLSSVSGGSASFLAGGEVPYPSVGANGQTVVQFKEYGIRLDVSPVIDEAGNVRTVVRTEISQIDPAVTVQGAPGLLTRRAETEVNVRSGETIVISGLLSAEHSKDIDRVPGIGRLPVIGALFRSRNVRDAVSELAIFVTPEVIEPGGALGERDGRLREASGARLSRARESLPLME